ncbi:hypothetical protein RF11_08045 [Thelohanellus kitauei]|uniref:Uncharacterized protein n=1 Tax=Thelohanellus kitauei TaxID=669202 RepID=A0A0C2M950_THEKT|nr:hypothetical protein RF11_08045 [Thelohanellus kitauei]
MSDSTWPNPKSNRNQMENSARALYVVSAAKGSIENPLKISRITNSYGEIIKNNPQTRVYHINRAPFEDCMAPEAATWYLAVGQTRPSTDGSDAVWILVPRVQPLGSGESKLPAPRGCPAPRQKSRC